MSHMKNYTSCPHCIQDELSLEQAQAYLDSMSLEDAVFCMRNPDDGLSRLYFCAAHIVANASGDGFTSVDAAVSSQIERLAMEEQAQEDVDTYEHIADDEQLFGLPDEIDFAAFLTPEEEALEWDDPASEVSDCSLHARTAACIAFINRALFACLRL